MRVSLACYLQGRLQSIAGPFAKYEPRGFLVCNTRCRQTGLAKRFPGNFTLDNPAN
jgi:hypothetical protein